MASRGRRAHVIDGSAGVRHPGALFDVLVDHLDRRTVFRNRPIPFTVSNTARVDSEHGESVSRPAPRALERHTMCAGSIQRTLIEDDDRRVTCRPRAGAM